MRASLVFVIACSSSATGDGPDAMHTLADAAVRRTLFVQLDGQAVTPGNDDPTQGVSHIAQTAATLSPYRAGAPGRDASIATITSDLTSLLAPYAIDVVTTRPAAAYDMVIVTDSTAGAIGAGAQNTGALALPGCDQPHGFEISYVFGAVTSVANTEHFVANLALAMFAQEYGVPITNKAGDCMCFVGAQCGDPQATCTLGTAAPIDTAHWTCANGATTSDDSAALLTAFGPS